MDTCKTCKTYVHVSDSYAGMCPHCHIVMLTAERDRLREREKIAEENERQAIHPKAEELARRVMDATCEHGTLIFPEEAIPIISRALRAAEKDKDDWAARCVSAEISRDALDRAQKQAVKSIAELETELERVRADRDGVVESRLKLSQQYRKVADRLAKMEVRETTMMSEPKCDCGRPLSPGRCSVCDNDE